MINVLVVGVGSIGERHVRCMQATGRARVGICELNAELRTTVADRYSIESKSAALDEALEQKWNAAVIAAPAHLHIPIAQRLAEAGVHLLIEKPLSVTTVGVEKLIETVERKNLVAGVAYIHRAHPMLNAFKSAIDSGRFGKPLQLIVQAGQHFPTFRPAYRTIYYANHAQGGGAIQDALSHLLDLGMFLVGPIDRLACDASHQRLDGVEVEDTVHLICRHENVLGTYSLNQHQAPSETVVTVVCADGTLRYELMKGRWRWMTEPDGQWTIEAFPPMQRDDWFTHQENAFLDAVEGKCPPKCSLRDGLATLRVQRAALAALQHGLPPLPADDHAA